MFRTVFPSIIRSSRLYTQHQVYVIQVSWLLASGHEMEQFHLVLTSKQSTNIYDIYLTLYVQSWTPDDGRKDRPKHVEWYSINSKNCASSWFYYSNISRCTVPCASNSNNGYTNVPQCYVTRTLPVLCSGSARNLNVSLPETGHQMQGNGHYMNASRYEMQALKVLT